MEIAKNSEAIFSYRLLDVAKIYAQAFAGFPWFENLSDEVVRARLESNLQQPHFKSILAFENNEIVGGLWYDSPNLEQLQTQRGEQLAKFAHEMMLETGIPSLTWEREVLVNPQFQGKGIGTSLRNAFIEQLMEDNPMGTIILTRMRDDNAGIIKIAEKCAYQRTGIRMPSSQNPEISHEYWYRIINTIERT